MAETRKYPRLNNDVSVSYNVVQSILGTGTRSKNISQGGICFCVAQALEAGSSLEMRIRISDENSSTVRAIGKVVWRKKSDNFRLPFEIGVTFTYITEGDYGKLTQYLSAK
jgi:hypothetical protein